MRERKVPSAAAIRRLRKFRPVDLASFGAGPTRRAGQFLGDRYRIEGLLGVGGTANVYLAVDTRVGHSVVVKQLNSVGAGNTGIRERFLAEAEALSNFQHPRIMRVLDFAAPAEELPYLVTEALVGETLSSLLRRRPRLPLKTTVMIARQTAQGLAAAHRRGLVHRDIKPDNLFLIGPRDAPFGLKIIDFGMAKRAHANDNSGVHTVLGTIEYMAPEQVLADPVDGRTDIYSFGIVLFRLLTGCLPFRVEEGIELLCHQLYSTVPSPAWFDDTIDPRMVAIVTRATRKHPKNRYPNIGAMNIDLDVMGGLCHGEAEHRLCVEPDRYEPQNDEGREVAALLAERHAAIIGPHLGKTERELAYALARPETIAPPGFLNERAASPQRHAGFAENDATEPEGPASSGFVDLSDEDLEVSEG